MTISEHNRGYLRRLDEAARAGWLYYVAGYKQDEIARALGVSRQTAQRLVAMAVREKLIRVRLDHPITRCMELAEKLTRTFGLRHCEVVPSDPADPDSITGLAQAGAAILERELAGPQGRVIAVGTGRALRACVEDLPPMNRPDHTVVALLGHMMPGGLSTRYSVVMRMADRLNAAHYPMPLPIYARTVKEREIFRLLDAVKQIHRLVGKADLTLVGIGNIGAEAPLLLDGVLTEVDIRRYAQAGAVGEIAGWLFDENGALIDAPANDLVNSVPLGVAGDRRVYGVAAGTARAPAIRAAMRGRLINCLITNETTAEKILGRRA